jgi:hypothetical protein
MKHQVWKWLRRTLDHLPLFFVVPLGYGILGPLIGWVLSVVVTFGFSLLALLFTIPLAYKLGLRPAVIVGLIHVLLMLLAIPRVGRLLGVICAGGLVTAADWFFFYPRTNSESLAGLWFGVLFGAVSAAICSAFLERLLAYPARPVLDPSVGSN